MGTLSYNGKYIIPAGLLSINKSFQNSEDGEPVGSVFDINYAGTLVAYKGSPTSSGTFWTAAGEPADEIIDSPSRLAALLKKKEALRDLFADQGKQFRIQPLDGTSGIIFNPRILDVQFADGVWHDRMDYVVTMQCDLISGVLFPSGEDNFSQYISSANENWNLEFNEQAEDISLHTTYRLTHNLTAQGKRHYNIDGTLNKAAWQEAKEWVQARLGMDTSRITAAGNLDLPGYYTGRNHVRTETVDENGGTYAATETWLIASGTALEDFTVETVVGSENTLTNVSVQGTITGLETRNGSFVITQDKWAAASGKWVQVQNQIYNRAKIYSGYEALNATTSNRTVGYNIITGTINYSYQFDDRPSSCISGAKSENIQIVDDDETDVFASIFVIGRTHGPVLQDMNTNTAKRREVSIEAVVTPVSGCGSSLLTGKPDVSSIITALTPSASGVYKELDRTSWSPKTGTFSRNVAWTYGN